MKLSPKVMLLSFSIILFGFAVTSAGTVDSAALEPAISSAARATPVSLTFSAVNDKAFSLKSYSITIHYTAGLTVSNLLTVPAADAASIDTRKNKIVLAWSNISPGTELRADFDVTGDTGTYILTPTESTFTDYNKGSYSGTCNTAQVEFTSDAPVPPLKAPFNVHSNQTGSAIEIFWDHPAASDVSEYRIFKRTADTSYDLASYFTTTDMNYSDSAVQAGTPYYYAVAAVNASGNQSAFSNETADAAYDLTVRIYDIADNIYNNIKAVTAAGDLNGDGEPDLVVGLPLSGVRKNQSGKVLIFLGGGSPAIPDITLYGEAAGDSFGGTLAVTDMNNDGFDELIVGAPQFDVQITYPISGTAYDAGKIYMYKGGAQFGTAAFKTFEGQNTGYLYSEQLGYALAPAGDVNGDGYNDVIVSAPYGGDNHHGRVIIIYGGPNTYAASKAVAGPNVGMLLGTALAGAGDVNNDGLQDIIAGAQQTRTAHLIWGGAAPQLADTHFGPGSTSYAGSVTGADLNGDGFSDILVGSYVYWGGTTLDNTTDLILPDVSAPLFSLGDADGNGAQDLLSKNGTVVWGGGSIDTAPGSLGNISACHDMDHDTNPDALIFDSAAEQIRVTHLLQLKAPVIRIIAPDTTATSAPAIDISGTIRKQEAAVLLINGQLAAISADGGFTHSAALHPGANTIEIIAVSSQGYISKKLLPITCNAPALSLSIDSAFHLAPGTDQFRIVGTVSDPAAQVSVNDIAATVSGNSFEAQITVSADHPLITAVALDAYGQSASESISAAILARTSDAAVAGRLVDENGAALSDAQVTLQDAGGSRSVNPDGSGTYSVTTEVAGAVTITYSREGFISQTTAATLSAGQTLIHNVQLIPIPALSVSISTPADGSSLHTGQVTVSGNVSHAYGVSVQVNGTAAQMLPDERFSAVLSLGEGSHTITASADDQFGQSAQDSVQVSVSFLQPVVSFSVEPPQIIEGQSATLSWAVSYANGIEIDNGIGPVDAEGALQVTPAQTTTYTLTATGDGGTASQSVTVTVLPPAPQISFTADPASIDYGAASTLSWSVSHADTVSIDNGIGTVALTGTYSVSPAAATTYTLTATGAGGTSTATATINVVMPEPTIDLQAFPGTLNVCQGGTVTLKWRTGFADQASLAKYVNGSFIVVDTGLSGIYSETVYQTSVFRVQATGAGGTLNQQATFTVWDTGTVDLTFSAVPDTIAAGAVCTLNWASSGADYVEIDNGIGQVALSGSRSVSPPVTTTYVISAYNPELIGTSAFATVTVTGEPPAPAIDSFSAAPPSIVRGSAADLTWDTRFADTVSIDNSIGTVALSGTAQVSPDQTTSYTLTATGPGGTATATATVTVTEPPPTVSFSADPSSIAVGAQATLTWSVTGADSVIIDNGVGTVALSGTLQVSPDQTTTYSLTATGAGGTTTAAATVSVDNPFVLTIAAPLEQDVIARPDVLVRGSFENSAGHETGITVNGMAALQYDNQFMANHVPLAPGENTITVTATDTAGHKYSQSVTVQAEITGQYISAATVPGAGLAPFDAELRIAAPQQLSLSQVLAYGPGDVIYGDGPPEQFAISIEQPGLYRLEVQATGYDNQVYTDQVAVLVYDRNELDALLQGKWNAMKACLAAGDVDGALEHYKDDTRQVYEEIFSALDGQLPQVAAQMQPIELIDARAGFAKYRIRRSEEHQGQAYDITYDIYFDSADNGIWKIVRY